MEVAIKFIMIRLVSLLLVGIATVIEINHFYAAPSATTNLYFPLITGKAEVHANLNCDSIEDALFGSGYHYTPSGPVMNDTDYYIKNIKTEIVATGTSITDTNTIITRTKISSPIFVFNVIPPHRTYEYFFKDHYEFDAAGFNDLIPFLGQPRCTGRVIAWDVDQDEFLPLQITPTIVSKSSYNTEAYIKLDIYNPNDRPVLAQVLYGRVPNDRPTASQGEVIYGYGLYWYRVIQQEIPAKSMISDTSRYLVGNQFSEVKTHVAFGRVKK